MRLPISCSAEPSPTVATEQNLLASVKEAGYSALFK